MRPGNSRSFFRKKFARASDHCAPERSERDRRTRQESAGPTETALINGASVAVSTVEGKCSKLNILTF